MLLRVLAVLLVVSSACGSAPTVTFERLDTASECEGRLPATAPVPVAFTRGTLAGEDRVGGVSEGTGHVALIARRASGDLNVFAVASDGRTTGCTTGAVDQGWDGTVVQQSSHDVCRHRWVATAARG